jgi:hypothetical protein
VDKDEIDALSVERLDMAPVPRIKGNAVENVLKNLDSMVEIF